MSLQNTDHPKFSRRSFLAKTALASTAYLLTGPALGAASLVQRPPHSKYAGVQIGVITYSFRSLPGGIQEILKHTVDAGISAVELMGDAVESYAGRPADPQALVRWRESVSMDAFRAVRKKFDRAGVRIYAYKQPDALRMSSTDATIEYVMRVAKVLGARSVTLELPKDPALTKRLGTLAAKHQIYVGYHTHTQATDTVWDFALDQSPYNSINLDCGHYIAAGGANTKESLLALIEAKHDRISSFHMKDRQTKANGGANLPWGNGDTPIREILLLLRQKRYDIPVSIELEYNIPPGSDAVQEVRNCAAYAKSILAAR